MYVTNGRNKRPDFEYRITLAVLSHATLIAVADLLSEVKDSRLLLLHIYLTSNILCLHA